MHRRLPAIAGAIRYLDRSTVARYAVAVPLVAAGLALREALLPSIGDKSPFLVSVLAVLLASVAGGFGPGVFATVLSAGVAVLLYLPPIGHVSVDQPSDLMRLAIFIVEGLIVAAVGGLVRRSIIDREAIAGASDRVRVLLRLQSATDRLGAGAPPVDPLTEREVEVLRLMALGLRNDEIAATLFVSGNTVKTHLAHAYGKLGVRSRTEAVARCAALGLLERPGGSIEPPSPAVGGRGSPDPRSLVAPGPSTPRGPDPAPPAGR